jgi:PDZ domain-containing protein
MHRSPCGFMIFAGFVSALLLAPYGGARAEEAPPAAKGQEKEAAPGAVRESPYLGISLATKVPGDEQSGVIVTYVNPASAAKEMGFQPGDQVLIVNDVIVTDVKSLVSELQKQNAGSKQRFSVRRGGMDLKIEGRISSLDKTMKAYQDLIRKDLMGKPLPELPPMLWWDAPSKTWKEGPGGVSSLRGKHSVVFSFDDCAACRQKRYLVFSQTKTVIDKTAPTAPLAILGVFYNEPKGKEQSLKAAEAILREMPAPFPVAVACYPGDKPAPEDRDKHALLHTHGTAIIDPQGIVKYVQTQGFPQEEFLQAYQQVLKEVGGAGQQAGQSTPPEKAKRPSTP